MTPHSTPPTPDDVSAEAPHNADDATSLLNMKEPIVLHCTVREGGYYTDCAPVSAAVLEILYL